MSCEEVDRAFVAGEWSDAADLHVRGCARCQAVRAVVLRPAAPVVVRTPPPSVPLLRARLWRTRARAAALLSMLALVGWWLSPTQLFRPTPDYDPAPLLALGDDFAALSQEPMVPGAEPLALLEPDDPLAPLSIFDTIP